MKKSDLLDLLKDLSMEEKIGQLVQVTGNMYEGDATITGPMRQMGLDENALTYVGSVLTCYGASRIKKIQKNYMEKHPHHIPLLFMMDVINGFKTVYPIPLGQGATFDPELSKQCAQMAAKESTIAGIHVTFSPMVDLVRDARWGRVMESTGEDPYLNSLFAEAMVQGYQGGDLSEPYTMAACVKHFAGYGAPNGGRDYNTVELSEHTFREFYLPAYRAGIDAGSRLVMTSFNTINGIPATGNVKLMRKILREEMQFHGVLISDWAAIEEMIYHGYAKDRREAAKRAITAGVDIDMMTGVYATELQGLIEDGEVDESLLDEAVLRVLELKNDLGLFENPYRFLDEDKEKKTILCEEHRSLARKAAAESFVLLKNEDHILPLDQKKKIAFIGPYVNNKNIYGSWSFIGDPKDAVTIQEAAEKVYKYGSESFEQGCPMLDKGTKLEGFSDVFVENYTPEQEKEMLERAKHLAEEADIVVLPIGEASFQSGEATSRAELLIPRVQQRLLDELAAINENIAVVLFNGRPLDLRQVVAKAKAVLEVWMPGTEGGSAILDVLSGAVCPSGKLSMSFPCTVGQVPIHYNEYSTGRPYVPGEDKDHFRSKYLDAPNSPLFPFGYGLSYGNMELEEVSLDKCEMTRDDTVTVRVRVKNTGDRTGSEVVQLYLQDVSASVVRPVKELKGFEKVTLEPGSFADVEFEITEEMLRFYNENATFCSEEGEFRVYIGNSSDISEYQTLILRL